jgi:arginyl-tRNA synthetase
MGDLAFPCFSLAKARSLPPPAIAKELAAQLAPEFAALGVHCEAAGPYLNFRFDHLVLSSALLKHALAGTLLSGDAAPRDVPRTVVIDYSSPNIAKPFSMGHLRSTSIGNALARIYRALGWKVVRVNHLGDWGTQFGKLIVAFRLWGDRERLEKEGIAYLMEIYVRFTEEANTRPELDDDARAAFKQLEDGDEEALALRKVFSDVSLAEFERIYATLNVAFDSYAGESFYNDKVEPAIEILKNAGILEESEGALVVPMSPRSAEQDAQNEDAGRDEGAALKQPDGRTASPPCMIRKSDGASTYAARDLAAIFYRWKEYSFDRLLYVVGAPQALHFKQLFTVLKKLNLPYADRCVHIPFGQVLLNGEMMSTRKGNVIFLKEVIQEASSRALKKMLENAETFEGDEEEGGAGDPAGALARGGSGAGGFPPASESTAGSASDSIEARAQTLAVSSILFYDLKNGRIKDVDFNWEEILNPHGETGIYLQYAHARIYGIMRKYAARMGASAEEIIANPPPVTEEESWPLFDVISRFGEKLNQAAEQNEPSVISRYLLDLASVFSTWYRAHRVINEDNPTLSRERMAVVLALRAVLAQGLDLLGIVPLEKM